MAQWEPEIVNTPPKQGIQIVISAGKGKYIQGAMEACVSRTVQAKGSGTSLQTDHYAEVLRIQEGSQHMQRF